MFDSFFSLFSYDLGLDLGTANTQVYVQGKGVVVREPSVVARHRKTKQVLSMGTEAKKMIGKTPALIEAVRPIVGGVIADFDATLAMASAFIRQVHLGGQVIPKIPRPRVVVSIPSGVTEVERRAVQEVVMSAGARKTYLIEQPMAAAIGAGIPVEESNGALVVTIGAGRTEAAVISLGGIVIHRSILSAGEAMDMAVVNYLRLKHSLLLGDQTAEEVKIAIGSATEKTSRFRLDSMEGLGEKEPKRERAMVVRGRSLETGLPMSLKILEAEVREAISPVVREIVTLIQDIVEATPPELVSDIVEKGVVLTGGGALLTGLDSVVAEESKLPVWTADLPQSCVVIGCGKCWDDEAFLKRVRVTGGLR